MPSTPARARLLIGDGDDPSAPWLVRELGARGVALEHVTAGELLAARRLEHRVGSDGATLELELADGRAWSCRDLRAVVNRLSGLPFDARTVVASDRDYAASELYALWTSCLAGLPCPVLNPPRSGALAGIWLDDAQWALHAGRAGLPAAPVLVDGVPAAAGRPAPMTVLVTCGAAFGPPAAAPLAARCVALAANVGVDLLDLHFEPGDDGEPQLAGACALADLRRGGPALADHLAEVLA